MQTADQEDIAGRIFKIQFFCVHDGPGIRTTVFFKGCPLRCLWCHNPEGIQRKNHLSFSERKCLCCGACGKVCPDVHRISGGGHTINMDACKNRGECIDVCPTKALSMVGQDVSVGEVLPELLKEKRYYETSGGGVTISGGEPVLQPEFLLTLLKAVKKENIHTAIETCGFCGYEVYETILPYVDFFLYDFKETNPELHKKYIGVDNKLILENLSKLHRAGANILLRCPIVHKLNDREDHFKAIAEISKAHPNLAGAEILPYHKLAASKIERMGLEAQEEFEQVRKSISDEWPKIIRAYGGNVIDP